MQIIAAEDLLVFVILFKLPSNNHRCIILTLCQVDQKLN